MPHKAKANLSALIESTEDLIWSVDLDYQLITFNQALHRDIELNYGLHAAVGMRMEDLLPPAQAELWPRFYQQALTEGPFRVEYSLHDGRTLELAFNPIAVNGQATGVSVFGKNITERKTLENALLAAESRYRALFDGAREGMFQTSMDARIVSANRALSQMLGYDSPEALVSEVTDVAREVWADPQERDTFMQQLRETGAVMGHECRLKRRDGSILWASLNCRKAVGGDGQTPLHEGFIEDITERKLAVQAVAERDVRFRKVFEENGSVMLLVEPSKGEIIGANAAAAAFYGYAREQLTGMPVARINCLPPAQLALEMEHALRAQQNHFNFRHRLANGEERDVEVYTSPINLDGSPLLFSVVHDITGSKQAQEALRVSEERYRTVFQTSLDSITLSRLSDGSYLDANRAFLDLMGFDHQEIIGRTSAEMDIWVDRGVREKIAAALLQERRFRDWETQFRKKNGQIFWVTISASLIEIEGVSCILSFVRDISEAKTAAQSLAKFQESLQESEERYRTAFQTSLDSVNINHLEDGQYVEVNQGFLDVTGFERDEVIGRTSLQLGIWVDPRDRQYLAEQLRHHSTCRDLKAQFRRKSGEIFWGVMSASLMDVDGVSCVLSVTRDISAAKAAEDEIRSLAFYDPLTGLPNRKLLLDRLRQIVADGPRNPHRQALLCVDLDDFKTLNDTLGHETGDLLLQEVARLLASCVRQADTVARPGGDEFFVILKDLSETPEEAAAEAKGVSEKIQAAVARTHRLDGHECYSTCSIGITVFGAQQESVHEVLQQADIAMHQAKAAGRNTVRFFAPVLQAAVNARAALEEDLRRALKHNEFLLYYQPQIESNILIGAEALIRWKHPQRGLLLPGQFIALAEETGLILPMGNWVLETACKQIAAWAQRKDTAHITLAVNISARQFRQPDFVNQVLSALSHHGANPHNLKLELTESMLLDNVEEVIARMTELKAHGLRFSLDDFGTGYSSLTYLKRLPLDQLKIDRSFVRDILVDASSAAIAQAIISLSRAMGMSVIAEGVEEEKQRDLLAHLGCHSYQGYFFSRPLPLEEFQLLWPGAGVPPDSFSA